MARTITVKGIGYLKTYCVALSMTLKFKRMDYDKAMDMVAECIRYFNESLFIYSIN